MPANSRGRPGRASCPSRPAAVEAYPKLGRPEAAWASQEAEGGHPAGMAANHKLARPVAAACGPNLCHPALAAGAPSPGPAEVYRPQEEAACPNGRLPGAAASPKQAAEAVHPAAEGDPTQVAGRGHPAVAVDPTQVAGRDHPEVALSKQRRQPAAAPSTR